mgnify:CR=1 FL=1
MANHMLRVMRTVNRAKIPSNSKGLKVHSVGFESSDVVAPGTRLSSRYSVGTSFVVLLLQAAVLRSLSKLRVVHHRLDGYLLLSPAHSLPRARVGTPSKLRPSHLQHPNGTKNAVKITCVNE